MQDEERKLREEERELIDRLVRRVKEIDSDFEAGLITPEQYQAACDVIDGAVDNINAISRGESEA